MKSIPGDPFIEGQEITKETLETLHRHYGLDKPLYIQYLKYLKGFICFDLGPSYIYQGRTVNQIIRDGFPVSITIGSEALILSILLGVSFGSIAALKRNKWQDNTAMVIAILGISIPNFFISYTFTICICY